MTFLTPILLWGMALAAVPLIIHLLFSRKVKVMDWAAMQFLLDIMEQQKRVRIEDILLLLLRMLLLLLLALAAAGPLLDAIRPPGGGRALIVVDGSFSMDTRAGVQSRWDRAADAVETLLDDLPTGTRAALLIGGADPDPVLPQFSSDHDLLVETLRSRGPGDGGGDPLVTARSAREMMQGGGETTTVYLVSDFQRHEWLDRAGCKVALDELAEEAPIELVPVGDDETANLVASDLRLIGGAAREGGVARFAATVDLVGGEAAREVSVDMTVDGQVVSTRSMTVVPDQSSELYFAWDAFGAGWRRVELVVTGDTLEADNRRHLPIDVGEGVPVLVVADDAGAARRASDFLLLALDPQGASDEAGGAYQPTVVDPGLALSLDLDDYRMVIWAHVAAPDAALADQLTTWVDGGGGAMIFLGPDTVATAYESTLVEPGHWPVGIGAPIGGRDGDARPMVAQRPGHPLWKGLLSDRVDHLANVSVFGAWPLAGPPGDRGSVLAEIGDAEGASVPLVADLSLGEGSMLVVGTSADPSLADLCLQPVFVGLIQQAAAWLRTESSGARTVLVGDPLHVPVGFERSQASYRVTGPEGDVRTVSVLEQDGRPVLQVPPLQDAGFYELENTVDAGDRMVAAANTQHGESRIASATSDELEAALASDRINVRGAGSVAISGWQLAGLLLILVIVVWISENLLAHRIARRNE